jgi:hypothetical protein
MGAEKMTNESGMDWYKGLGDDPQYLAEDAKIEFALQIERRMEAEHVSRVAFAERMDCSPSYVTKLLRGDANCTIETMVRAAHALGAQLHLAIADRRDALAWVGAAKAFHLKAGNADAWLAARNIQPVLAKAA